MQVKPVLPAQQDPEALQVSLVPLALREDQAQEVLQDHQGNVGKQGLLEDQVPLDSPDQLAHLVLLDHLVKEDQLELLVRNAVQCDKHWMLSTSTESENTITHKGMITRSLQKHQPSYFINIVI